MTPLEVKTLHHTQAAEHRKAQAFSKLPHTVTSVLKEGERRVYAARRHKGSLCTQKQPGGTSVLAAFNAHMTFVVEVGVGRSLWCTES